MNDTPTPFAPFQPQPIPAQEAQESQAAAPDKSKRGRKPKVEGASAEPKRRAAPAKGAAPKFELNTILGAAAALNQDDYPLFGKLVDMLDEAGKPGRERLLAAIGKVFG